MEIRNKKLYNKNNGKLVLVQVRKQLFSLKFEREIISIDELDGILNNNDVYLLTKGD